MDEEPLPGSKLFVQSKHSKVKKTFNVRGSKHISFPPQKVQGIVQTTSEFKISRKDGSTKLDAPTGGKATQGAEHNIGNAQKSSSK